MFVDLLAGGTEIIVAVVIGLLLPVGTERSADLDAANDNILCSGG